MVGKSRTSLGEGRRRLTSRTLQCLTNLIVTNQLIGLSDTYLESNKIYPTGSGYYAKPVASNCKINTKNSIEISN